MNSRISPISAQRGQSLTEFVAVALALVPLFLIVPLIGKYQDIGHMTQLASRYVAFDATVRNNATGTFKPEAQMADEVRRRFFSNSDAPIKTGDTAGNFTAHRNMMWVDTTREPLIKDFATDVTVSYGPSESATHDDAFTPTAASATPFQPVAGDVRKALGLSEPGIYRGNVSVILANVPNLPPFDAIDLAMTRQTSLIIDPWAARDPQDVERRINTEVLFPVSALAEISSLADPVIATIDWPGAIPAPKLGQLEFWRDVVPQDRLRTETR